MSEDPYLNGAYAAAVVTGMQDTPAPAIAVRSSTHRGRTPTPTPPRTRTPATPRTPTPTPSKYIQVSATCKHLAAYSFEMGAVDGKRVSRHKFQANITAQELAETYLPAFQGCVEGGRPQQIMCSYNSLAVQGVYNSTPMCLNKDILDSKLRGEWGFDGSVVADCDAVSDAYDAHHWGPGAGDGGNASAAVVVAAGLDAGCDQDCGSFYSDVGAAAVAAGVLPEVAVDRALERILMMRFKLGEFDPAKSVPYNAIGADAIGAAAHTAKALQAARESIALLNNSAGVLPFAFGHPSSGGGGGAAVHRILVAGPLANFSKAMQGAKSDYNPRFQHSVLDGLRRRASERIAVSYSPGLTTSHDLNTSLFPAAVAAARAADVTVVVVGISGEPPVVDEQEGHDRSSLALPGAQSALVQALYAAVGPSRLVVVLLNGGPVSVDWIKANVPTVLEGFEGGQSGGDALADVLFGDVAPSGVLPYTVYDSSFVKQVNSSEMSLRARCGKTYRFYRGGTPLWPFGHSQSYTTWAAEWQTLPPAASRTTAAATAAGGLQFTLSIANTGRVASAKVVLIFVSATRFAGAEDAATIVPPLMQLFAVEKVFLHPGQQAAITVSSTNLPGICGWCTADDAGTMRVRAGDYTVFVGDGSGPAFPAANISIALT